MIEAAIAAAVERHIQPIVEELRRLRALVEKRLEQPTEWVPTAEAARRLGISRRALDARRRRGAAEARREGGRWLYSVTP